MGRKKIQISRITDERNRQVTFNKRKFGVMKKAYELSVLCDCEIALIIFSSSNKLYQYASTDMDKVLLKYTEYNEPHESVTNKNIIEVFSTITKKENKNGLMSPDSPEQEADYTLTPRTEAKYSKMEEEFQLVMQRNQLASGRVGLAASTYSLPVSVPVGSYGDSNTMLQASPQMAHTNISPRPSSSETDSIYQSGNILEISNGYPHSSSPLGRSPSPGPSPLGGHRTNKSPHQIANKQHSSGNINDQPSNLRVVIPTTMTTMSVSDDISFNDQHRHPTSSNTPIVAIQTPISTIPSYSFGAQDFSMSSSDVMTLPSWTTHSGLSTVHHASALSHLVTSNSTPPSTSPLYVKVKSEPISPPRDHHHQQQQQNSSCGKSDVQSSTGAMSMTTMNSASAIAGNMESQNNTKILEPMNHPQMLTTSKHLSSDQPNTTTGLTVPTSMQTEDNFSNMSKDNSQLPDYDSSNQLKRPRISGGWSS